MDLIPLTYVEIDINYCSNTFGSAPCTASGSGDAKCVNTRNISFDCQDTANFTASTKTVRFGIDNGNLPESIPCIPNLLSVSVENAVIKPGENIGERATCTASFKNHRHGDSGFDKYIVDRTYNPFDQGTFWGKFRARNSYLRYRPMRVLRGYLGDAIGDFTVENFVVDQINGPGSSGNVTIRGVDFMRLLGGESSQAPVANKGYLSALISDVATSATLSPSGIGDLNYSASGHVAIGEEIMSFTRTADVLTLTRAQYDTDGLAHKADDVVQEVLIYTTQTSAYIINDLVVNYTPLDTSYTDLTAWNLIVTNYSSVLYTAVIPKPESVVDLINELVEQAGLKVFGDNVNNVITFDVIRPITASGEVLSEQKIIANTFQQTDQPNKRYSQVWLYYYQRNYFKNLNDPGNYYSGVIDPALDSQYETESVKKIFSRWIPTGGRSVASDVTSRLLARYVNPPRKFAFGLFPDREISLGQNRTLTHTSLEGCLGLQASADIVVTGIKKTEDSIAVMCEELNFDTSNYNGDKYITIDTDSLNVNLRTLYDNIYASVDEVNDIIFVVSSGVVVGSSSVLVAGMDEGTWPAGATLFLVNNGFIVGRGGNGSSSPLIDAQDGGTALLVTRAIDVDNTNGVIGGGGGGGGGGYIPVYPFTEYGPGGGGAGYNVGLGANGLSGPNASNGLLETGGSGYDTGGDGGDLGVDGDIGYSAASGSEGAAGAAIDGHSFITYTASGDIRGSQIN